MSREISTLTSLRFIAAACIVYVHGQGGIFPKFPFSPLPFALGVSFFLFCPALY